MGEARFKRLVAPYQITQGVFPVWVTKALPSWLTYHSAFLFGTPGNKALRGLPAAAIRMLDLSHHDVRRRRPLPPSRPSPASGRQSMAPHVSCALAPIPAAARLERARVR